MIGVTITGKAYAAIAPTLPAGSVAEKEIDPGLEYRVWLPMDVATRLKALRKPGETFSDVILRLGDLGSYPRGVLTGSRSDIIFAGKCREGQPRRE